MFKSLFFISFFILFNVSSAYSSLIISEILADPPPGALGDANGDGVGSTTQDEFLEFFNDSFNVIDVSGWSVADAISVRHFFPAGTIVDPYSYLVVFGGGSFTESAAKQKSSTGSLSLNNTGDSVRIFDADGVLFEEVNYGSEANHDQSLARAQLKAGGDFILHSEIPFFKGAVYSPGFGVGNKSQVYGVPEPFSVSLLALGLAGCGCLHRKSSTKA